MKRVAHGQRAALHCAGAMATLWILRVFTSACDPMQYVRQGWEKLSQGMVLGCSEARGKGKLWSEGKVVCFRHTSCTCTLVVSGSEVTEEKTLTLLYMSKQ